MPTIELRDEDLETVLEAVIYAIGTMKYDLIDPSNSTLYSPEERSAKEKLVARLEMLASRFIL
jgi:hypothetical protein